MPVHATRDHLVYPVAAALAIGLVAVAPGPSSAPWQSAPRFVEVSAVQLSAAATALLTGLDEAAAADPKGAVPPAAAATTGLNLGDGYGPITQWLGSLPLEIRNILLPPLYAVAWVIGLVTGIVMLVVDPIIKLFNPEAGLPFPTAAAAAGAAVSAEPGPATVGAQAEPSAGSLGADGDAAASQSAGTAAGAPAAERAAGEPTVADSETPAAHTRPQVSSADRRGRTPVVAEGTEAAEATEGSAVAAAAAEGLGLTARADAGAAAADSAASAARAGRGRVAAGAPDDAAQESPRGTKRSAR